MDHLFHNLNALKKQCFSTLPADIFAKTIGNKFMSLDRQIFLVF